VISYFPQSFDSGTKSSPHWGISSHQTWPRFGGAFCHLGACFRYRSRELRTRRLPKAKKEQGRALLDIRQVDPCSRRFVCHCRAAHRGA
jgi:hypothetical protein